MLGAETDGRLFLLFFCDCILLCCFISFTHLLSFYFNRRHQRVMARSQGNLTLLDEDDAGSRERRSSSVTQRFPYFTSQDKKPIVLEKITIQRTKSNPHLARAVKEFLPANPDENVDNNGAANGGEEQVNLAQLLGRKIRSSLIAQWESKIQVELQSTS